MNPYRMKLLIAFALGAVICWHTPDIVIGTFLAVITGAIVRLLPDRWFWEAT